MRFSFKKSLMASAVLALTACSAEMPSERPEGWQDSVEVLTPDQIEYQPLNPARGDAAPQAGTLWGDIREDVASGIILKFADGFSSPPHIHNITYRSVVISGHLHNDDPKAAKLWMEPGSFWTQAAGEDHITAAKPGSPATAFLEILSGPYLVQPSKEAFDIGEQSVNIPASKLVWLSPDEAEWIKDSAVSASGETPEMTMLWGDISPGQLSAAMLKLPAGYKGALTGIGSEFKAIVIYGNIEHNVDSVSEDTLLPPGGFFTSAEQVPHNLSCVSDSACQIYVRTKDAFKLK